MLLTWNVNCSGDSTPPAIAWAIVTKNCIFWYLISFEIDRSNLIEKTLDIWLNFESSSFPRGLTQSKAIKANIGKMG